MKITNVLTQIVEKRNDTPLWNPREIWHKKNAVLVFIETDEGITGVGESWSEGGTSKPVESLIHNDIKPLIVGEEPTRIEWIWKKIYEETLTRGKSSIVYAAMSGVDIALWDILGKTVRRPVCDLLGCYNKKVFAYASGGLYGTDKTNDKLADEMKGYVDNGFKAVKIKVGSLSIQEEIERVSTVRSAIGDDIRLMVDAVYSLDLSTAIRLCKGLEHLNPYFMETPIAPNNIDGLKKISNQTSIHLAGNEIGSSLLEFRELITSGALTYIHFDCTLCGGITEAVKIAALAAAWNLSICLHCSTSIVSLAANLHLAASIRNCDSIEYHMVHQLLFDRIRDNKFKVEDSYLQVPDLPGIGVDILPSDI
jgi:L-alanine-DL-glutamate epimerase-like enolase superfamily enzyme